MALTLLKVSLRNQSFLRQDVPAASSLPRCSANRTSSNGVRTFRLAKLLCWTVSNTVIERHEANWESVMTSPKSYMEVVSVGRSSSP